METKQYSTPQFDLIRRDETERVFFQTSGGSAITGTGNQSYSLGDTTGWY